MFGFAHVNCQLLFVLDERSFSLEFSGIAVMQAVGVCSVRFDRNRYFARDVVEAEPGAHTEAVPL